MNRNRLGMDAETPVPSMTIRVTIRLWVASALLWAGGVHAGGQSREPGFSDAARAEGDAAPDQDTPVPEVPSEPRLLALPLIEQVCEETPPIWALSSRDNAMVARWSRGPLFIDGRRLLWGSSVIDAASGKILEEFPFGDDDEVITKAWLSRNRKFVLLSRTRFDRSTFTPPATWLEVWDLEQRRQHGRDLILDEWDKVDADLTTDGNTVAVATRSDVELWDVTAGEQVRTLPVDLNDFEKGYEGRAPFFSPEFLRFSPDNRWLVVFSPNNVIYSQWQTDEKPKVIHVGRRLQSFAFTPDSRLLAEGPGPRTNLHVRELGSCDIVRTLFDEADSPLITTGLAFTPDGKRLIAGNDITVDERKLKIPHRLHFWDVEKGTLVRQLAMPLYLPRWLDVSPDGRWLAVRLDGLDSTVLAVWPVSE